MRINYWLWHIVPGSEYVDFRNHTAVDVMRQSHRWHDNVVWLPIVDEIVLIHFGKDIGPIVMYYIKNMIMIINGIHISINIKKKMI